MLQSRSISTMLPLIFVLWKMCRKRVSIFLLLPVLCRLSNFKQLAQFSDMCGAEIPRWIRLRLESYGDDLASIRAFGLDVVTELCEQLLQVVRRVFISIA